MLLWEGRWHAVAMNANIAPLDDLIGQVASGFTFGAAVEKYGMCYGEDPNQERPMMELSHGGWVTLMPG